MATRSTEDTKVSDTVRSLPAEILNFRFPTSDFRLPTSVAPVARYRCRLVLRSSRGHCPVVCETQREK